MPTFLVGIINIICNITCASQEPLKCLSVKYLLEVAITIKGTFPKSSTKEVKRILHSVLLGIGICQLTEERSTGLEGKK